MDLVLSGPQGDTSISLYTYDAIQKLDLDVDRCDLVQVFGKGTYYVSAENESYDQVIEFLATNIIKDIQNQAYESIDAIIYFAIYPASDNLHVSYVRCSSQEWEHITPQEAQDLGLENG